MTKGKLIELLENVPDYYDVCIDENELRTVFVDHSDEIVHLSSSYLFQYAKNYNPFLPLATDMYIANKTELKNNKHRGDYIFQKQKSYC